MRRGGFEYIYYCGKNRSVIFFFVLDVGFEMKWVIYVMEVWEYEKCCWRICKLYFSYGCKMIDL